jgi:Fe-S cluster assembly protein SufD
MTALAEFPPLPQFKGTPGWEFTDLSGLDLDDYGPAAGGDETAVERVTELFGDVQAGARLTQVDGVGLRTDPAALPDGVIVEPLEVAAQQHPELVNAHLGRVVTREDAFTARNRAGFRGGAFVYVPRGVKVPEPIVLSAVQDADRSALHWRVLVVLEEGAEAEVWEQYLSGSSATDGLFTTVVELSVGQNAHLRFLSGQALAETSWIFGSQRAEVQRDATLDWVVLGFGTKRGKVFQETKLAGPGSTGKVTGAYATRGRQHVDFDTLQEHAAPDTVSDLAFRGVLGGRSTAVWRGMIRVDEGAQKTDAFQESRNLLLSGRAHADAIPGLEIQANDVRCTHAAAIAQIDPDQLFYLRSRGVPEAVASRLVIEGFLEEIVGRFEEGPVREVLAGTIERRLQSVLG